ncbi:DeoR/GlpR family DNA-binding transcription regulator [Planococcus sp. CAU13]|uniref:DeoR/GlpR family DNA-binding transcription regulator n=1 Tax=Planococcus sp. CAU13 TaxID=1541197 RepID=UPI001F34C0E8|nr:DeoR/GlpR family DNA-binding transcription regulator [Planococcus sp. CAU13]
MRKKRILETLSSSGKIDILDMVNLLNVSAMTVRRDLDDLERQKRLIRTHGGAALPQMLISEQSFKKKVSKNLSLKVQIAKKAVNLVKEGMTVSLDTGTTTLEIAKLLKSRKNITVVTNDIKIASELMDSKLKIIIVGGHVQNEVGAIYGPFAESILKNIHVDIAFLGAHAIHATYGIASTTFEKATIKKMMIEASESVYVAVDTSKFNQKAFAKICNVDSVTGIITDNSLSSEIEEIYEKMTDFIKEVDG